MTDLITLLEKATSHGIAGRVPNPDWHDKFPDDPSLTLCVRLTVDDRDAIIAALKASQANA